MQKISVANAAAVGLGAIIGAGIFVLSGTAIALAGPYSLLAFILVGAIALIMALVIGELSALMPNAKGATYSFAYNAFGSEIGFITGIAVYLSFSTAISAIALGFGTYLASLLNMSAAAFAIPFAILLVVAVAILNIAGITKAAKTDFWLVIIKLSVLFIFAAFALLFSFKSGFANTISNFSTAGFTITSIFAASVAIFFAYSGFQTISTFTSKIKNKGKGAAKAIVAAVLVSIIVYVLIDFSLMILAPASAYRIAADPLAFALRYAKAPGVLVLLVDIGALVATTSATLAMMLSSSRMLYQLGKDGLLPKAIRKYNAERDVATNGVVISAIIGIIMLFSGNIYIIAAISNFGLILSYIISCLAQIHFRRIMPKSKFTVTMPLYPYLTVIAIVALLALLIGMPREALVIGDILVLALLLTYYFFRELKGKKPVKIRLFD